VLGLPAIIDTQDHTLNGVVFDTSFIDTGNYEINDSNGYYTITPRTSIYGLQNIPVYTGKLTQDTYPYTYQDLQALQNAINKTFDRIQGAIDAFDTQLYGMDLAGTKINISLNTDDPDITNRYNVSFTYNENNYIKETDYQLEFYDDPSYNNNTMTSWNYYLGFTESTYTPTSLGSYSEIIADDDNTDLTIGINTNNSNNIFYLKAIPSKQGVYSSSGENDIKITIAPRIYTKYQLISEVNNQFSMNPKTVGSSVSSFYDMNGQEHVVFRLNINKTYTAQDYTLTFFDKNSITTRYISNQGTASFQAPIWDTTVGWILGFHSYQTYNFSTSPSNEENIKNYIKYNSYTITSNTSNPSSNIVSLTGDATLNVYLYNQFYIVLDDYTQNHLNDGVVTVTTAATDIALPSYSNRANFKIDPASGQPSISLYRSDYGGTLIQPLTTKILEQQSYLKMDNDFLQNENQLHILLCLNMNTDCYYKNYPIHTIYQEIPHEKCFA
jgi:hypothetical protein